MVAHTSDEHRVWLRTLPSQIRFESDGVRLLLCSEMKTEQGGLLSQGSGVRAVEVRLRVLACEMRDEHLPEEFIETILAG